MTMKWPLVLLLALGLCGCGTLRIEATPTPEVVQWMTATAAWEVAVTQILNSHGERLDKLEAAATAKEKVNDK